MVNPSDRGRNSVEEPEGSDDEYIVDVEVSLRVRSEGERPSAARANAAADVKELLDTLDRVDGMSVGTSMKEEEYDV